MEKPIRTPVVRTLGWLRDLPDFRDYTPEHEEIRPLLAKLKLNRPRGPALPATVDLRPWCSTIEDQRDLNSCSAHAGVGLLEFVEKKAFGKWTDASRLFLYWTSRTLVGIREDEGCYLRATMGAMRLCGVPPEKYWPYKSAAVNSEPPTFAFALAQNYQALRYFRLDPPGTAYNATLLANIKSYLAAKLPCMFGFTVYTSIEQADSTGKIPVPLPRERSDGGHAVCAVGYDDGMKIKNSGPGAAETTGAFLIRNSWGTEWGAHGYGYLPYEYVLRGLTADWWTLMSAEWVDTGQFGL
jgi:C1A family cysteine protease